MALGIYMFYHKRLYNIALLLVQIASFCAADISECVVDNSHKPTPALQNLLTICQLPSQGTICELFPSIEKAWKRPRGKERWEIQEIYPESYAAIRQCCDVLCLTHEVMPMQNRACYDYCIILGATVARVRMRLAYAISLWNQGIRFKTLVFLGCERPLDSTIESEAELFNTQGSELVCKKDWTMPACPPKTEFEMMRMVYDQALLPAGVDALEKHWVNAPMKLFNGALVRADTADTVYQWMKMEPKKGSCLVISNQPFVGYQHMVLKNLLPGFSVETVGPAIAPHTLNAIILDALVSWLAQIIKASAH